MKITNVIKRVDAVLAQSSDPESAHHMDDDLREEFLSWLAHGAWMEHGGTATVETIGEMASILLQTKDITRWYA